MDEQLESWRLILAQLPADKAEALRVLEHIRELLCWSTAAAVLRIKSLRSPRSGGSRPPSTGLVRPQHQPAAASRRSLQACSASLPFAVLLDVKDIPQVGPLQWGRITIAQAI
jgi:hypothetical protein